MPGRPVPPPGGPIPPGGQWGPPRSTKKSGPQLGVILALIAVPALIWLVLSLIELAAIVDPEPRPNPIPTVTEPDPGPAPDPGVDPTPSIKPRPGGFTPRPQPQPPAGGYKNADYTMPKVHTNPPPIPEPRTYKEAEELLTSNAVYNVALSEPVECTASAMPHKYRDVKQTQAHLEEYIACLTRVWGPALQEAGYEVVRTPIKVYTDAVQTGCGKLTKVNATYCGADQRIYFSMDLPRMFPKALRDEPFGIESVIAHEFGHSIQARTGILVSSYALSHDQKESVELQISRRIEVQADCFATAAMGSTSYSQGMTDADRANVNALFYSIGDDVLSGDPGIVGNHGRGKSRKAWAEAGFRGGQLEACNSFTAPASKVR